MKAYKVGLPGLFLFLFALAGSSESIKEEGGALMLNAWVVSTLKAEGLAPELIADLTARIRNQDYKNIHSLLIARNGNLVYEEYFPGADGRRGVVEFDKETLHDTRSVSKSIASSLIGIAIDQGYIGSVDEPMYQYFPDYTNHLTEQKKRVTLEHLLSMTAGFKWDQSGSHQSELGSANTEAQMENSFDFIDYVLSADMSEEPGERFNYNSGCAILLAGVIRNVSGMHADKFADKYLFGPLGIDRNEWWRTKTGLPQTHAGLRLRPRDMAKIGQLYLNNGRWKGLQILPASWVEESIKPHFVNDRYGYAWWLDRFPFHEGSVKSYVAEGNGGQFIFVIPDLDLVVVFTGGNYGSSNANQAFKIVINHVLKAVSQETSE